MRCFCFLWRLVYNRYHYLGNQSFPIATIICYCGACSIKMAEICPKSCDSLPWKNVSSLLRCRNQALLFFLTQPSYASVTVLSNKQSQTKMAEAANRRRFSFIVYHAPVSFSDTYNKIVKDIKKTNMFQIINTFSNRWVKQKISDWYTIMFTKRRALFKPIIVKKFTFIKHFLNQRFYWLQPALFSLICYKM